MPGTPLVFFNVSSTSSTQSTLMLGKPAIIKDGMVDTTGSVNAFLQWYDATSTVGLTIGTTPPYQITFVSPGDNDPIRCGAGMAFYKGICATATTTPTGTVGIICTVSIIVE